VRGGERWVVVVRWMFFPGFGLILGVCGCLWLGLLAARTLNFFATCFILF
jgi:hypothetical protein